MAILRASSATPSDYDFSLMTTWFDTSQRYGLISRAFHWLMAALFAWQFAGALLYTGIGDTALTRLIGSSHFTLGFTLFILVLLRGTWGLVSLKRRPPHSGHLGRAAVTGHGVIYALMIVVPSLGLMRQYGSGHAFSPYSIPLMSDRDSKIDWMIAPADLLHHWLGFALLAVICGHAAMVLVHRLLLKEEILKRMM
jgi:cytochrome b561